MVTKKTWEEFRECGMLWLVNTLLHVFGWSIIFELDTDRVTVKTVYPARVKFRGFGEKVNAVELIKVSKFLKENADNLYEESKL